MLASTKATPGGAGTGASRVVPGTKRRQDPLRFPRTALRADYFIITAGKESAADFEFFSALWALILVNRHFVTSQLRDDFQVVSSTNSYPNTLTTGGVCANDEPIPIGSSDKVDLTAVNKWLGFLSHQNIEAVNLSERFTFIWLIQSQSQRGAASAISLDHDAQIFARILLHDFFDFVFREIRDFDHNRLLSQLILGYKLRPAAISLDWNQGVLPHSAQ